MMAGGDALENAKDMQAVISQMKPSSELCPGDHAYALLQGLGLAHMDAHLSRDEDAIAFLGQDLKSVMAARGVEVEILGNVGSKGST